MASATYVESLLSSAKRLKISPPKASLNRTGTTTHHRLLSQSSTELTRRDASSLSPSKSRRNASHISTQNDNPLQTELRSIRLPKAVRATYLTPLKRTPVYGIPVCDLQLRSYSVRNLELFADFCLRAAYYLNLPAKGPVPLPKITERWTVPRSNFVHKKSQENFERVTMRRLVQIQDGHPETVAVWLAYIQKNSYYGVGMKANVFEHGELDVGKEMDKAAEGVADKVDEAMAMLGGGPAVKGLEESVLESKLHGEPFKAAWGAYGAMGGAESADGASERFSTVPADVEERVQQSTKANDESGLSEEVEQSSPQHKEPSQ